MPPGTDKKVIYLFEKLKKMQSDTVSTVNGTKKSNQQKDTTEYRKVEHREVRKDIRTYNTVKFETQQRQCKNESVKVKTIDDQQGEKIS